MLPHRFGFDSIEFVLDSLQVVNWFFDGKIIVGSHDISFLFFAFQFLLLGMSIFLYGFVELLKFLSESEASA